MPSYEVVTVIFFITIKYSAIAEIVSITDNSLENNEEFCSPLLHHKTAYAKLEYIKDQITEVEQQLKTEPSLNCLAANCKEVQRLDFLTNQIYQIQPKYSTQRFSVQCNMVARGGGWTYILNRYDGSQDFYLDWKNYKYGFGNITGEFWLGLENIHLLTGYEFNELLIQMEDWNDTLVEVHYDLFTVMGEREGYQLKFLKGYSGDVRDSFSNLEGMKFTTKDKDQDLWHEGNCADISRAGWWYHSCKGAQLTGMYSNGPTQDYSGMLWASWHGGLYSLKQARMMVRPWRPRNSNPLYE